MLVLHRSIGESVLIETQDGVIEVKLLRASPGYARLGFDAPAAVRIRRQELAPFVGEAAEARNG